MIEFEHIGIEVTNLERSKEFYTQVLECEQISTFSMPDLEIIFLKSADTVIELIFHPNVDLSEKPLSGRMHLAFLVHNLDIAIQKAESLGAQNIRKPFEGMNKRIVFFNGPDNELLEFAQIITEEI